MSKEEVPRAEITCLLSALARWCFPKGQNTEGGGGGGG